jgi:hypothetical protein
VLKGKYLIQIERMTNAQVGAIKALISPEKSSET